MNSKAEDKHPELPALARLPLQYAPVKLKSFVISRALNTLFATPLAEDELEFLNGRRMNVCISDAGPELFGNT
jgi:predicted lipid carrier protein YhbT